MKCCVFCSPICDVAEILCEVDAWIAVAAVWDVVVVAFEAVAVVVVDVADFVWVDAENRLHDCAESARTIEITPIWRRYMELELCRIDAFLYRFWYFCADFALLEPMNGSRGEGNEKELWRIFLHQMRAML